MTVWLGRLPLAYYRGDRQIARREETGNGKSVGAYVAGTDMQVLFP